MWDKKGLIFNVDGSQAWNKSHAQTPVVDVLDDRLRIYFATRNAEGKSNISFIETEKTDPAKIRYVHNRCLFQFGKLGTFDDSGVMPSCILTIGDHKYLYYIGWTTRSTVPYQNAVGLAVSTDGGITFSRMYQGPIISVNSIEPYFSGTSFVKQEGRLFRMWYLSCTGWTMKDGKPEPLYNIKYAESIDGKFWNQTGSVAIELEKNEGGLVSATVIHTEGHYRMWYGKRKDFDYRENTNNSYRIGYAESIDGVNWLRRDELSGIDVSEAGWDSQMISYPYVVVIDGRLLMFYNGNGFGRSGFGYAEWNSK